MGVPLSEPWLFLCRTGVLAGQLCPEQRFPLIKFPSSHSHSDPTSQSLLFQREAVFNSTKTQFLHLLQGPSASLTRQISVL